MIFLSGGITEFQLYNKYSQLNERARKLQDVPDMTYSSNQDYQPTQSGKPRPGIFGAIDKANAGLKPNKPIVDSGFAESQKIEDRVIPVFKDLTEYRQYIDNPDPDDPNLDNKMVQALKISLYESIGYSTLLAILIFIFGIALTHKSNSQLSV